MINPLFRRPSTVNLATIIQTRQENLPNLLSDGATTPLGGGCVRDRAWTASHFQPLACSGSAATRLVENENIFIVQATPNGSNV